MAVTVVPRFRPTMTGTLLLVVLPFPSWPRPFQPQLITWPPDVSARLWLAVLPAPTAVMVITEGTLTATGVLLLVVVPLPSCPYWFEPQASAPPVEVNAKLWLPPAAMAVTVVPGARLTVTGMLLPMVLPSPSWPALFEPQASLCPVDVSARLWL